MCSDGVTEGANENDEEFGDRRPAEQLRESLSSASIMLRSVVQGVQRFSGKRFQDDVTLVAARYIGLWTV
jgi:serine phosphatase RsbU (regulator of sigma subunit)